MASSADFPVAGSPINSTIFASGIPPPKTRPLIAASTAQAAAETIDIAGPPAAAGVAADRATAAADASHAAAPALVSVGQGATLGDAVAALARARVHRVWRLGPSDEPIGVFTLTDALRAIVDAAGGVEA
jgi:hypothetical protein